LAYNIQVSTMTVSEARAALPELLDRVIAGEEITITRHGRAVAVVVRPDVLRVRRADHALARAAQVRDLLAAGRDAELPAQGLSEARAEELIAEVRAAREPR
jgi:antitoxin (DNA-binding transcriptional repressor) of toxin-antitoxin stability system